MGAAVVAALLQGGFAGALVGMASGACCFAFPAPRPSGPPDPVWIINIALYFAGCGASLAVGSAAARRSGPVRSRVAAFVSGLCAPLAGAAPSISFSALREGRWQWEIDFERTIYFSPRFLALVGVALGVGRLLSWRDVPVTRLAQRFVLALFNAIVASLIVWSGIRLVQADAVQDFAALVFETVVALIFCSLFAGALEMVRPIAESVERWLDPLP